MNKCAHCGEQHTSSKCPALSEPLKDGFYSGGGGGGNVHDEERMKNGNRLVKIYSRHLPKQRTILQNVLLRA